MRKEIPLLTITQPNGNKWIRSMSLPMLHFATKTIWLYKMAPQSVSKSTVHNTMSLQMKMIFFYTSISFSDQAEEVQNVRERAKPWQLFPPNWGTWWEKCHKIFLAVQDNSISDIDGRSAGPRIIRALIKGGIHRIVTFSDNWSEWWGDLTRQRRW